MQEERSFQANPDFILREIMGEFLLVPSGNIAFNGLGTLNDAGVFLWKALAEEKTWKELVACFMERYDVEQECAETDILEFLRIGVEKGAITEGGYENEGKISKTNTYF